VIDLSDIADELAAHHASVTRELLECSCGWYTKRGVGAKRAHALHVAAALADGGLI
jgi:hypothetical protein